MVDQQSDRPLIDLLREDHGQLATEWLLVAMAWVIPMLMLLPVFLNRLYEYFYHIVVVLSLPFP